MDVTDQIRNTNIIYGCSDNTNAAYLSASKSLNYELGASINKPLEQRVTTIPFKLRYQDSIGLFGAENFFIKVNMSLQGTGGGCYEETGWQCAIRTREDTKDPSYDTAAEDYTQDLAVVNTYFPAEWNDDLLINLNEDYIEICLENLKTGNQFVDNWFDVRLYTMNREEHPYNFMLIHPSDFFYIGFHARNTRRLPYNVQCTIGNTFVDRENLSPDQRRYIMRK